MTPLPPSPIYSTPPVKRAGKFLPSDSSILSFLSLMLFREAILVLFFEGKKGIFYDVKRDVIWWNMYIGIV